MQYFAHNECIDFPPETSPCISVSRGFQTKGHSHFTVNGVQIEIVGEL